MEEIEKKKLRPSDYCAGMEVKGNIISKVYFFSDEKEYLIFKNIKEEIKFFSKVQVGGITTQMAECNFLMELLHGEQNKEWVNHQKAVALNEYFLDNEEKSIEVLNKTIEVIKRKEATRKKIFYIGTYLAITMIMLILSLFFSEFKYLEYLRIATFGAFGGFISLNTRLKKVEFDISETDFSYIVVSIYRMAFACISSIISFFLIESDMIFTVFKNSVADYRCLVYIVAAIAGFSESLLPNIFSGIEKEEEKVRL